MKKTHCSDGAKDVDLHNFGNEQDLLTQAKYTVRTQWTLFYEVFPRGFSSSQS